MTADERTAAYINSLDRGNTPLLDEIEKEALKGRVPVIRRDTQSLMKLMLEMKKPGHILEIGTGTGFSALLMSEYAKAGSHVTTIEQDEKRAKKAGMNFRRAGREHQIKLMEGDAADILRELLGPYDFIFLDAAKGQYLHFLPELLRLLGTGGVLFTDNVLQGGDVIESRFAVTRRGRTIHSRMREYLYELKNGELLTTAVLPVGDGVAVSVKR